MKISESGLVGTSFHRTDVLDKVTGCAVFVDDIQFGPNLLHSRLVRSPHPHARILSVDTSKAEAHPGVKAVVTGADFPGYIGLYLLDRHIFARDRARYVGDPIVGVAATSEVMAEEALDLINVEYEVLEPVLDAEYGASPESPLIHPRLEEYQVASFILPQPKSNISNYLKIQ